MEEEFSIGYWIKRRRKALDMTQKDLANYVGCASITIAKIESDERRPSTEMAELLAEHLDIPVEQRATFVKIMRGLKSSVHLRNIAVADFQSAPSAISTPSISALEAEKLRGLELIRNISRSKLVARGAELTTIRNHWELAKSGESQALILQGEPGIGKSRLGRELLREIKTMGGHVLVGECFAEGGMPYAPIVRILQSEALSSLKLPKVVLADLKTIAPALEIYLPEIPANPALDPHAEQMRLFESIYTYFRQFYEKKPLIILVEDIHWADHGSIALLQALIHRFRQMNAPVLTVFTTREISPEASSSLNSFFDDLVRSRLATTIHLDRFDASGTHDFLAAIFAQEITDEFIQFMHQETQGNPFFIEEVCKDLIESRQIYWDQGRWERKNLTELRVPQNIRAAVQARLNKLGKATHALLEAASVIGSHFEFDVLRLVVLEEEDQLIESLQVAKRAQIILETSQKGNDGLFEFSHVLIASVLREGLSSPRRRAIHKRIVDALQTIQPDDFSLLAHHSREAADHERTAHYFRKAGEHAMRAYAHEDAIHFYSEALRYAPKDGSEASQILLARARVYDLRGQRSLQLTDLQAAEARTEAIQDASTRAAVALARAEYAIQVSELNDVIEYARRAIALSERAELLSTSAQAYLLWGRALSEMGELHESREYLMQAGKIARETSLKLIEARSMINLGNIDYRLGDYVAAEKKYVDSLETIRMLGERRIECMVINNLGNIYWTEGNLDAAIKAYAEALEIARAIGDRLNEARALSNIGSILTEQYHYPEALQRLEQALPLLQELGQQVDESIVLGHLADVMEALGRYDEAFQHKANARELAHKVDDAQTEAEFLTGLSRIETFRENFQSAEQFAQEAIAIAQQHGYRVEEAAAWQALGFFETTQQDLVAAEEAYSRSLDLYEELNQASKCAELRAELGCLAHERGDQPLAHKHVAQLLPDRSPGTLETLRQPSICWCCFQILKTEEAETASVLLKNGYTTLQNVLARIHDLKAREHYLNKLPHHAALMKAWEKIDILE